jgi:hypothetical protein
LGECRNHNDIYGYLEFFTLISGKLLNNFRLLRYQVPLGGFPSLAQVRRPGKVGQARGVSRWCGNCKPDKQRLKKQKKAKIAFFSGSILYSRKGQEFTTDKQG